MASSIFECARRVSCSAHARIAVVAAALAATGPALGQQAPRPNEAARAAARAKLVQGVDALQRGEHRAALDRFQEAYALVPSPKIHYDFGLAYLGLGRHADALSAFERFLAEAQDAPADKREKADGHVSALRARVGTVAITVKDAPAGSAIAVDGHDVARAPLPRPVYLDPGPHEIAVRLSGGGAGPVQRIEVRPGANLEIVLRVHVDVAAMPAAGPARAGAPLALSAPPSPAPDGQAPIPAGSTLVSASPAPPHPDTRRIVALSLGAAGVALLAAGVTFGALAKSESDSLTRDSANGAPPRMPTPFDPGKESRGMTYETLQVIGLVAGGLGLASGIVLYTTSSGGGVTIEPVAIRSRAGANLHVAF